MDLYTMDLKDFANEDGLPIMDSIQFKRWTEKLGKERFREVLSEYIATYRPKFPLNNISYQEMKDNIIQLSNFDTSKICTPKDQSDKIVGEKYDDYEHPYSKYGLSKKKAEDYIIKQLSESKIIKYCIGRIFSIYDNIGKDFLIITIVYLKIL